MKEFKLATNKDLAVTLDGEETQTPEPSNSSDEEQGEDKEPSEDLDDLGGDPDELLNL